MKAAVDRNETVQSMGSWLSVLVTFSFSYNISV